MKAALPFLLLMTGCSSHTAWQVSGGHPNPNLAGQVQVSTGSEFATVFGLAILAAGIYEVSRSGFPFVSESSRPPEMAPDRKVSEQDCTKPLDYTLGNIRCK